MTNIMKEEITLTIPQLNNYDIKTIILNNKTYKLVQNEKCADSMLKDSLEDLSWNDIFKLANEGMLHTKYKIGASKDITLKSGEVVTMQFADYYDGHATFISKDCLETPISMKYNTHDYPNGFEDSIAYKYLNNQIFNLLPDDLHDLLYNGTAYGSRYLTLPSESNVFGEDIYAINSLEDHQWAIFEDPKNRIKKLGRSGTFYDWWEFSVCGNDPTTFCGVNASGAAGYDDATYSHGVPLCFST